MDFDLLRRAGDDTAYADGLPAVNGDRAVPEYDAPLPLAPIEVVDPILLAGPDAAPPGDATPTAKRAGSGLTANVPPVAVEPGAGPVAAPGIGNDPILKPAEPTPQRRGALQETPDTLPGGVSPVERAVASTRRMLPTILVVVGVIGALWLLATDRKER